MSYKKYPDPLTAHSNNVTLSGVYDVLVLTCHGRIEGARSGVCHQQSLSFKLTVDEIEWSMSRRVNNELTFTTDSVAVAL